MRKKTLNRIKSNNDNNDEHKEDKKLSWWYNEQCENSIKIDKNEIQDLLNKLID